MNVEHMNDPRKKIVILAIAHQCQRLGNPGNAKLEECVRYLGRKFKVQVMMEEWTEEQGRNLRRRTCAETRTRFCKDRNAGR